VLPDLWILHARLPRIACTSRALQATPVFVNAQLSSRLP